MADTKLTDLTAITSTDGSEALYAVKGGVPGSLNIDVICNRAVALVPAAPESMYYFGTTTDATPTDLTNDGTGSFSGSNGLLLDFGAGPGVVGYEAMLVAHSTSGEHLFSTTKNVASYDLSGPTAALLGTDTFTVVDDSAGASAWVVTTVVDPTTMYLYFQVTGDIGTTITWGLRLTPVRLQ